MLSQRSGKRVASEESESESSHHARSSAFTTVIAIQLKPSIATHLLSLPPRHIITLSLFAVIAIPKQPSVNTSDPTTLWFSCPDLFPTIRTPYQCEAEGTSTSITRFPNQPSPAVQIAGPSVAPTTARNAELNYDATCRTVEREPVLGQLLSTR